MLKKNNIPILSENEVFKKLSQDEKLKILFSYPVRFETIY